MQPLSSMGHRRAREKGHPVNLQGLKRLGRLLELVGHKNRFKGAEECEKTEIGSFSRGSLLVNLTRP